jgi:hypothetical protein
LKSNKFWAVLLAALLAVSAVAAVAVLSGKTDQATAQVYQDGALLRTIDLSQVDAPYTFEVTGPAGTNTVQVERGRIRVSHADCPDQVCVHQGWISDGVVPIVCLPNALVIQLEGASSDLDGVAG